MKNMKYLSAILVLTLSLSISGSAQKLGLDAGLKVGANFSNINGKYWENGYKANFLAGAFAAVSGPKFGVQLEALFSQSTYTTGNGFYEVYKDFYTNAVDSAKKGSFKVNNLSIPVLLNVKLVPMVAIQLGPQFTSVMSASDKENIIKDPKELFKSSWDGVIGLQLNLPFKINIGARYIIGLSDVNKNQGKLTNSGSQINDAWKNKTLQVHIGYAIL
jgi:hypothetical protein